ncbi:MAG: large conductance mechanosensitive channel protein MscL [Oscillospiraceae bacterium]|nr:large conductance mechanosensitive channel protein MscL [Oscillospiraceae bacterium]
MFDDFKKFAFKGNVMDMAIGVVIGGAFGKIVTSLVNDMIMPLLTLLTGKIKFENLFVALNGETYETIEAAKDAGAATLNYGMFVISVIDFLIIAASIFIVMKQINQISKKLQKKKEEPEPTLKECPFCKSQINIKATRCPNCTSQMEPEPDQSEPAAEEEKTI